MNTCEDTIVVRDNSPRSRELLVKAARMYFLDGRSQDDIARVLETSRSNVSRMLRAARMLGIVEIRIQDERGRDADLEQALAKQFDLTHVRVAAFRPEEDALAATSALAAEWLDDTLRDGQILALSWGTTVQAVVAAVAVDEPRTVEVVPLVGGLGTRTSLAASQELVRDLAARLGTATYRYLYSPALLHSESARDALLAEPWIGHTVARARCGRHRTGWDRNLRLGLVVGGSRRSGSHVGRSATPSSRSIPLATRAAASSTPPVGQSVGWYTTESSHWILTTFGAFRQ